MTEIFEAIDLTAAAAAIIGMGVLVIGIHMAYKSIDLGKRAVKKA